MNEALEVEYKQLITKEVYDSLLKEYKDHITRQYEQTNHYLNHPILSKLVYSLRIRDKWDGTYELTLKRPQDGFRLETNIDITKEERDAVLNGNFLDNEIFDILKELGIKQLDTSMYLTTYRTDIIEELGVLSIDHDYNDVFEDYELEFEVNNRDEGFIRFLEIIKPYHLNYTGQQIGKILRTRLAYEKAKKGTIVK